MTPATCSKSLLPPRRASCRCRTSHMAIAQSAMNAIRDAAKRSGDQRLLALIAGPNGSVKKMFGPIIKKIDVMIDQLKGEEDQDLETKQTCEEDRMANTRKAIVLSRGIDEATDLIAKLTARIAECQNKIRELDAEHEKTKEALAKATKMRKDENEAWKETDADDKLAAETVQNARDVLANFYKDNNLALMQTAKQPVSGMAAGDAPPPPPTTWEGDYGGKTGESQGIVAIMDMVRDDIVKDRKDAKADEDASQQEFDDFKADSKAKMKSLREEKDQTEKDMGRAETKKSETEKQRGTKKG